MTKRPGRPLGARRTRAAILCTVAAVAGVLLVGRPALATPPKPPPHPTSGQVHNDQNTKDQLAAQVGTLTAQVASAQAQLTQLKGAAELAEQQYANAYQQYQDAQQKASDAKANVAHAEQQVEEAKTRYVMYAQSVYTHGSVGGTAGTLLTAADPNSLLEQTALQSYESSHQLSAIGQLQQASIAKSNADSTARKAEQDAAKAKDAADQKQQEAISAAEQAQAEAQQVSATLATRQTQLNTAKLQLAQDTHQLAVYNQWKAHQAYLAHLAALKAAREKAAREAAAAAAAARARARAQQQHHDGGHGGGTSVSSNSHAPIPTGGQWTPGKGRAAVARAENWLGEDYAWAGGNASGPTYGVCAGDGAWNDCHIVGFDCSGLTLYAWAPFTSLAHYTVTQYNQGSYHPSPGNFEPGDLLFWSNNGSVSGIHHVAIYIGGGLVIQAPQSGDIVRKTPWQDVDAGYYGATRPLT